MADRQRDAGMDISTLFGVLRRRILVVVLAVGVAAGAAYFISKRQDEKYTASATLLLRGGGTGPDAEFTPPLPESAPDRESLVLASTVLDRAERRLARRLGRAGAEAALSDLTASSGEESDVVTVEATTALPKTAALAANTVVREVIGLRADTARRKIARSLRGVESERAKLGGARSPDDLATLNQLNLSRQQLKQAESKVDGDAEIVKPATVPTSPSAPKPARNALIGGFAGLLLGLALALIREQLDRRVRASKDLEAAFGLPVLASVPRSRALHPKDGTALRNLPPLETEAFQMLRANLHYLNTDVELRSVVVTSAGVGDGKSTVALNLAKADATVGRTVLLVEADIRRPRLATLLGLRATEGLADFLADRSKSLASVVNSVPVVQRTNGTGASLFMDVVVAGAVPSNPSELIDSARMRELIREGEEAYDLVVIDTAPAGMVSDAIPLMSEASAVVVVGRVGRLTTHEADALREQLERIDAPSYGLVANFSRGPGDKGYGYY